MHRLLNSKLTTAGILILLALIGLGIFRRAPALSKADQQARRANEKLALLEEETAAQKERQHYLANQAYLERQARIQLGLKKAGEQVVYVYRSTTSPTPIPMPDVLSNVELWWYYLIGKRD